jgi:two-component system, cell cycle response regulator DivK
LSPERLAVATILVVDDEELVRELAAEALALGGHTVLTAASSVEGIELARARHPDLILMDMALPDMTGVEAVRVLREDSATHRIPIVALTGGTSLAASELIRAGCIAYIAKPVTVDELERIVTDLLRVTAPRRRPRPS